MREITGTVCQYAIEYSGIVTVCPEAIPEGQRILGLYLYDTAAL